MKMANRPLIVLMVLFVVLLVGCTAKDAGPVLLNVTGMVEQVSSFTEVDLEALGTKEVDFTEKSGDITTYVGVPVMDVLNAAELKPEASIVVFVADDEYEAEATLEEIESCVDCVFALVEERNLQMVMPDFSGKLQVKDVVEFRVE